MSAGSTTLIVGGGFGGIATARLLRAALPSEHEIRIVSRSPSFQMGTTKTWVMLGLAEQEKVTRSLDVLRRFGIDVFYSEVRRIDPGRRAVTSDAGDLSADYLVIATGAELDMGLVPGLASAAETFYTREGALRLREILKGFGGGRIVFLIPKIPFQCPPGPYEAAMLLHSHLEERGIRTRTSIDVHTIEKAPMATGGPAIGRYIVERLGARGIGFHPQRQVQNVDGDRKVIVMADRSEVPYDLLIAIPPHVAPRAVRDSGLTNQTGWIPVDPKTFEIAPTPSPGHVFAIGDVTSVSLPGRFAPEVPLVLPKAGVFAERQGAVVAGQIAAHLLGKPPGDLFDGKGYCYIEVGSGEALRGDGSFFDLPNPAMTPRGPDAVQLAEKKAWVGEWLATYLEDS